MNPLAPSEAKRLGAGIRRAVAKLRRTKVVICPPALFLPLLAGRASGKLNFGAQDIFTEKKGAYTGALSAEMFAYAGASYALVGHSERRAAGELSEQTALKVRAALRAGLKVVLCVGERERDAHGQYFEFLREQVTSALNGVPRRLVEHLVLAYEPVWAIGGEAAAADTPADFLEKKLFLRKVLSGLFGQQAAKVVPVLYGGSVDAQNALEFLTAGEADGLLVGHASLRADKFGEILNLADSWKE